MKIFMATSFFLGILFLFLAARGFRKTRGWFGARRLLADVVEVEYQDVWEKKDVISEAASRIRVTLQFFCDERRIVRDREYQGILRTSFRRGDKVPVFYDPETGQWIPRGEVRWNWLWQLLVALFFLFLALCAVLDGRGMAAQISDSGRLGPSLTGRTIYLFGGVLFILAGLACARWLVPACFSPILSLIRWKLQEGAGGLEELDGQCMGLIRQKDAGERRSLLSGFPLLRTGRPGAVELRRSGGRKRISAGEVLPDLPGERNRAFKTEADGGRSVWRYCLYYPISGLRSFRYLSAGIWSEPYLFGSDRGMVDLIRKSAGEL